MSIRSDNAEISLALRHTNGISMDLSIVSNLLWKGGRGLGNTCWLDRVRDWCKSSQHKLLLNLNLWVTHSLHVSLTCVDVPALTHSLSLHYEIINNCSRSSILHASLILSYENIKSSYIVLWVDYVVAIILYFFNFFFESEKNIKN